jgi:glycosyltransferase involved in cell wall biosynthesis
MSKPILISTIVRPTEVHGVQAHIHSVRDWLADNNRTFQVITPFDTPNKQAFYLIRGVNRALEMLSSAASVWWYRNLHGYFLRTALGKLLKKEDSYIVYAQCPVSVDAALRARRTTSQVIVAVIHFNVSQANEWVDKGVISPKGHLFNSIKSLESRVLPKVDGLVFVSEFMKQTVLDRIPACQKVRSLVVPNFVKDHAATSRVTPTCDLITIGTLEPRKNQRYALEIILNTKLLGKPLTLTVIGDGPDRADLENRATLLGIQSQVRFTGSVTNAVDLMPSHRAYLHVAVMESFGIVLIEAMSHGLPVFAAPVGGIHEVFSNGKEGLHIPLDDARAAAIAILGWLNDVGQMRRAGAEGRKSFVEKYEASKVGAKLVGFLDEIEVR